MKLVVVGAQWGDEGKGKIVDFLAEGAQIVLRYSGGANAGHTVVTGGQTFKLHLIPSGLLTPGRVGVLGIGMVVDLQTLFEELEGLQAAGVDWQGRVLVSDRAHLVLPRYKELDKKMERERRVPLGTTGRGIGVAYALKASREGIRVADLYDPDAWKGLLPEDRNCLEPFRERLREMVVDVSAYMQEHRDSNVLFEGAQGGLLDLDLGTYPFVSSGMSCAGGAAIGAGIGPQRIDRVIGVCKAYSTRVGSGPFPSEYGQRRQAELGERLREIGREYGATTGRPRRCGALDMVALRYACRSNSIDSLCLTKLDVYDTMQRIEVCTAYRSGAAQLAEFPAALHSLEQAEPVLESMPGWQTDISGCRSFEGLPAAARDYIGFIEQQAGAAVDMVSVGAERSQTIVRRDPWTRS